MSVPTSRGDDDGWVPDIGPWRALIDTKTPKLPTSLRIGFKTYGITTWPMAEAFAAEQLGACDSLNSVIRVADGRSTHDTAETFLHEVLHAAWHVARLEEDDSEERIVSSIASTLAQTLRDNPDMLSYLADVYA